jgi:hypothetical protein
LREVEAPTLLRQTANRWWQGCQPYAPAALYPQFFFLRFLVLISVRGGVCSRAIVGPEGLGKLKKSTSSGCDPRYLPVCSIVPQLLRYRVPSQRFFYLVCEAIGTAATPGLLCQPRVIFFLNSVALVRKRTIQHPLSAKVGTNFADSGDRSVR